MPDPQLFLYAYVRREAVLSSQIEGTQSSLSDLLLFELDEAPGAPAADVVEVSNYIAALEHGMGRLRAGFPLCNRLLREMHAHLMSRGRGSDKAPGEFRRTQNWIGGTRPGNARFVPPPPQAVESCMAALERFIHGEDAPMPVLLQAALAHVQFETIHRSEKSTTFSSCFSEAAQGIDLVITRKTPAVGSLTRFEPQPETPPGLTSSPQASLPAELAVVNQVYSLDKRLAIGREKST